MAGFLLERLAAVLGHAFHAVKFLPYREQTQRGLDFEDVVATLLHIAQQMNWARIEHLHRLLPLDRMQALWQRQHEEIEVLLRKAALPARLDGSVLAEQVLHNLQQWQCSAQAASQRRLQVTELRDLQYRLEDLADALLVYAQAKHDQWCDTQPMA